MDRSSVIAALVGGGIAGVLDLGYAVLIHGARGVPALTILQSIASGVLGRAAYAGGLETALLGVGLHFMMTIVMAAAFIAAFKILPFVQNRPLLSGSAYGALLYGVMNYVVVPFSHAFPGRAPEGWMMAGALSAHVVLVGLPIAASAAYLIRR